MPVAAVPVRNVSDTKVILSNIGDGESIEWGHRGIQDGSDLQEVPEDVWMGNKCRQAVTKGILSQDTPEEMEKALARQQQARNAKSSDRQGAVDEAMRLGTPSGEIVISSEDITKHLDATAKRQESDVLDRIKEGIPTNDNSRTAMDAVNSL